MVVEDPNIAETAYILSCWRQVFASCRKLRSLGADSTDPVDSSHLLPGHRTPWVIA